MLLYSVVLLNCTIVLLFMCRDLTCGRKPELLLETHKENDQNTHRKDPDCVRQVCTLKNHAGLGQDVGNETRYMSQQAGQCIHQWNDSILFNFIVLLKI